MDLRADLCHELLLAREFGHEANLGDGARERLLAIDMAARTQRGGGDDRMRVVRRGDRHGVNALEVQHAPVVEELLRARVGLAGLVQEDLVHVAERDDVFMGDVVEVVAGLVGGADGGDVQLLIGRHGPRGTGITEQLGGNDRLGGTREETAAGKGA